MQNGAFQIAQTTRPKLSPKDIFAHYLHHVTATTITVQIPKSNNTKTPSLFYFTSNHPTQCPTHTNDSACTTNESHLQHQISRHPNHPNIPQAKSEHSLTHNYVTRPTTYNCSHSKRNAHLNGSKIPKFSQRNQLG